ncbi:MAG: hypothetical protein KatS3mg102_2903 [Planctomycetota bacterium]|nr:MAG: hypothetical protein KatS3mg102_2903 [Planctomycetota bacterium]
MAGIERIFDGQTRYAGPGASEIDHAASARENLRSIADTLRAMRFDHSMEAIRTYALGATLRDLRDHFGLEPEVSPELTALKGAAMFPLGLLRDAAEIALAPLLVVKDAADAAWHGLLAGLRPGARRG